MESITIIDYKETDGFKSLKNQAWAYITGKGSFNIDAMLPAEYKYFDKLLQIYGNLNSGAVTKEQAIAEDNKNYAEYVEYKNAYIDYIHNQLIWQENYKATHDKLEKIEKSKDINEIFTLMAECMSFYLARTALLKGR